MKGAHKAGDLVFIPQAVNLIDYEPPLCAADPSTPRDPNHYQISLPRAVYETEKRELGVVIAAYQSGRLEVYCSGKSWSVQGDSVYALAEGAV